jgi:hypothetical protein
MGWRFAGLEQVFRRTLFGLMRVWEPRSGCGMDAVKKRRSRWCWRKDLGEFRGLSERERAGFLLVLEWFENFRARYRLEAGREAARQFWKLEVRREGCTRDWSSGRRLVKID